MDSYLSGSKRPARTPYITVELAYDCRVCYSLAGEKFDGCSDVEEHVNKLNDVLERFRPQSLLSRFDFEQKIIDNRANPIAEDPGTEYAQSGIVEIVPKDVKELKDLVNELKVLERTSAVWKVQTSPIVSEPSSVFEEEGVLTQDYLKGIYNKEIQHTGIGLSEVDPIEFPNARGQGINILDIERNWNLRHPEFTGANIVGAPVSGTKGDHGTAVLGLLVGQDASQGISGISPEATVHLQSYLRPDRHKPKENIDLAIKASLDKLNPGDIILLEVHAKDLILGVDKYVAMRYWASKYSAIREAAERDIIVIEAAGNGGQDFDSSKYKDSYLQRPPKDGKRKEIQTLIVGASTVPTYYNARGEKKVDENTRKYAGSRYVNSNYGKIVNVHAWGQNVITSGFGHLKLKKLPGKYTWQFGGTSSAAAIVAGTVACMQSYAKHICGHPLKINEIIQLIEEEGTKQTQGIDEYFGKPKNIGYQPYLPKILKRIKEECTGTERTIIALRQSNDTLDSIEKGTGDSDSAKKSPAVNDPNSSPITAHAHKAPEQTSDFFLDKKSKPSKKKTRVSRRKTPSKDSEGPDTKPLP